MVFGATNRLLLVFALCFAYPLTRTHHVQSRGRERARLTCDITQGKWLQVKNSFLQYNVSTCGAEALKKFAQSSIEKAYEWIPSECPALLTEQKFIEEKISNKRIAFVGDSLARNQYFSFLCLFRDTLSRNVDPPPQGFDHMRHFPSINTTVGIAWSVFLVRPSYQARNANPHPEPLPVFSKINIDVSSLDDALLNALRSSTHVVLNTGGWWSGRREWFEKSMTVLFTELQQNHRDVRIVMQYSGFASTDADDRCGEDISPVNSTSLLGTAQESVLREASELITRFQRMYPTINFLNTIKLSALRVDNHPGSPRDCQHWLLPGVPDTWNFIMLNQMF